MKNKLPLALVTFALGISSCGDDTSPRAKKPLTAPGLTRPTPKSNLDPVMAAPVNARPFWVGKNNERYLVAFNEHGAPDRNKVVDLTAAVPMSAGGITSMQFVAQNLIAVFLDPGTTSGGESIYLINTNDGKASEFYRDAEHMFKVEVNSMIFTSNRNLLVATKDGVEALALFGNHGQRIPGLNNKSFIQGGKTPGPGHCENDKISSITSLRSDHEGAEKVALISAGNHKRINIVSGVTSYPSCIFSYDYENSGLEDASHDIAMQGVQMPDQKLYVLMQNKVAGPRIVSFEYNGSEISSPKVILNDLSKLGENPRSMIKYGDSSLLVANNEGGFLTKVTTGGDVEMLPRNKETANIGALLVEP